MISKLLKPFLIVILSLAQFTSYGQFNIQKDIWNNIHGKVQSFTTTGYATIHHGDTVSKRLDYQRIYWLNKKGQVIKISYASTFRDADIKNKWISIFKYDTKGNLTEETHYDTVGKAMDKVVYSYSSIKKLFVARRYNLSSDSSRLINEYKVSPSGKVLEIYHYNEYDVLNDTSVFVKTTYKYNTKGLRVEEVYYTINNEKRSIRRLEYNHYGDMSLSVDSIPGHPIAPINTLNFTYPKYDIYKNWLESDRYIRGRLHGVTERQITYFK
ncbi:hypothetical protein [Mucilaginibacter sp. UYCu711]|uniref:hypothetical protein n=1 Tax=Mucilaginibacter sp. UYCu711 TaxID=3156339 RepID=UPI003D206BDC